MEVWLLIKREEFGMQAFVASELQFFFYGILILDRVYLLEIFDATEKF